MSDLILILVVAAITYLSRAAVVLLPAARGEVLAFVTRIPAPLFASLAVFALIGDDGGLPEPAAMAAAGAALIISPKRNLGLILAAGIVGYLLVTWVGGLL